MRYWEFAVLAAGHRKYDLGLFCFLYSLTLFNAWVLVNAQLARLLKLRDGVLPVTQLYMKIATLMAIYRNIAIQPEPPPDPVAP